LTGVPVARGADTRRLLDPEEIDDPLLAKLVRSMCVKANGRVLLVSPCGGAASTDVRVIEPKRELMELFGAYAREAYCLLGIAFVLLLALLAALFRRRFFACAAPVAAAMLATLGVLGWCGVPLTFFHALCFFVCTGLGLDYAIFHLGSPPPRTRRVVFVSFLTSAAAFGMLAFTSFAVTRAMGATLALGLLFAYLFSRFSPPPCGEREDVVS
jgi:predicted exporter